VEQPRLPEKALVIRGGLMSSREDMEEQAADEFEMTGRYALSVGADAEMDLRSLCMANRRPNRQIRKSTVGRLRAAGFEVTFPIGTKRHSDLILPIPTTDDDWEKLDEAFDLPEQNPYYYAKRGGDQQ